MSPLETSSTFTDSFSEKRGRFYFLTLNSIPIIWAMLNAIKEQQNKMEEQGRLAQALSALYPHDTEEKG